QFLKAERDNCIVWAFGYNIAGSGRSWSDSVTDIVRGLYCQEEEIELEFAEEVVLLSGYKGGYVPPGP
ncbi:MAG: hypothetical protein QF578_07355, partial [Alphaproteobacteria bacterium]|nr:hypothetical protein [Alphaproteobacteria bacterium]